MATRAHVWFVVAVTAAGCSNIGPFRANGGDDDGDPDAGVGGDGRQVDSPTGGDGQQVATPRQLATSTRYPSELAATGGTVYFPETGIAPYAVARVSAGGGQVKRIELGDSGAYGLAANSNAVVFELSGSIVRANSAFTGTDPLVTTSQLSGQLAMSSSDVYYSRNTTPRRIERVSLAGGTPEPLYTDLQSSYLDLATSATDLYWTAYDTDYQIRKSTFAAPASYTNLASREGGGLSAFGSTVCWIEQPDINQYKYDVWCHRQGTAKRIARDFSQVFDLLVTADDVFIGVRGYNNVGEIWRYHLATQTLDSYVTLDTGDLPTALAADGTDLFWVAYHAIPEGTGAVYALAL